MFRTKYLPVIVCMLVLPAAAWAQDKPVQKPAGTVKTDSIAADTLHKSARDSASAKADSLKIPESASALPSEVKYNARDSIIFDLDEKKVYLYGKAHMDYTDIKLDADYITIDYIKNQICAEGRPDSTGKIIGKPVFVQGGQSSKSEKLCYNFKSKKGRISGFSTTQGEGFVHGEEMKYEKVNGKDVIFVKNASYTTCDLDHPHFYLSTPKMKLMPGDKVVTGPAHFVIEDVPIPIYLPFGFFPANSRKTSGIIVPAFGQSATQGYVLRNGGYYYGGSDYIDAALTADIYTGGSYKISLADRYAKKYRFNGNLSLSYARNQIGLKETPGFNVQQNFFITWHHQQDVKANPGTTFSADVNAGTGGYLKRNTYTVQSIATQNLSSSVSYSKRLGSLFTFTAALRHSQSIDQKTVSLTLPEMSLGMNRINPFKSKSAIGHKWYHDVNLSFTASVRNILNTYDSLLNNDLRTGNFETGGTASVPVSTSFRVFRYFTLNPSINNDFFFYREKYIKALDESTNKVVIKQTIPGFYMAMTHSVNANLTTLVYGTFNIKRGKIEAIRHVITPTFTVQYHPDYGTDKYGYYGLVKADTNPASSRYVPYSYYQTPNSVVGSPSMGKTGSLGFSVLNNLEMKVKNTKDTANPFKKIKLLENLTLRGNYNFLADTNKLSVVVIDARTTLFEKLVVQGSTTFDPYYAGPHGITRYFDMDVRNTPAHLTAGNVQLNFNLNKAAKNKAMRLMPMYNPYTKVYYPEEFANFNIPWNVAIGYNLAYSKVPTRDEKSGLYTYPGTKNQTINIGGDLNLTSKWQIKYVTGYDFTAKNYAMTKFTILRDLHCWQMSFEWVPAGPYRAYFFNIHIKAPSLQDLKYDKRKEFYDFDK